MWVVYNRLNRLGGITMKLMCKCGNIEDIKTDAKIDKFELRNCGDGTTALVCKNCNEVVFIKIKNKLICLLMLLFFIVLNRI